MPESDSHAGDRQCGQRPPAIGLPGAAAAPSNATQRPPWLNDILARTPARLLVDSSGPAYRTSTQLALRADHAAARDAVSAEVDLEHAFGSERCRAWQLLPLESAATTKSQYLLQPELGRQLSEASSDRLSREAPVESDVQIVIGDGLSAAAVERQVPRLMPMLLAGCASRQWSVGRVTFVRHCRVGILNVIGAQLRPKVVVLLIGERPGLATAESLSAYLAYRPTWNCTDADRNLISNIHDRGVPPDRAGPRILALVAKLIQLGRSGVDVKEDSAPTLPTPERPLTLQPPS